MGIHLVFQYVIACHEVFCYKTLVFNCYLTAFVIGNQKLPRQSRYNHNEEVTHQSVGVDMYFAAYRRLVVGMS